MTKFFKNFKNIKMKKKFTIAIIIPVIFGLGVCSQTLQNTTWKSFFPNGTFFMYYHIGIDTLSISSDNITYTNFGTYQAFENNLIVVDLPGGDCPLADTGRYTFLIHEDTLKFNLVSDPCAQRTTSMTTFHFVRFTSGIQNSTAIKKLKLFPNPANNQIGLSVSVKNGITRLSIFNVTGKRMLDKQLTETETQIDISALPQGVYFVRVQDEKMTEVTKLVKQ